MNNEQERAELLPCPFCGGEPSITKQMGESLWSHDIVLWTQVQCDGCEAHVGPTCEGFEVEAVDIWNRRAAQQSQDRADAERYRYLIDKLQRGYDGEYFETDFVSIYCHMRSQFKGDRVLRAETTWRDKTDEPIGLSAAIDHARRVEGGEK